LNDWLQLVGSGLLLYFGGEWFVGGASTLAVKLRVPQILVGLTVVAYGTSAPEIIVGLRASSGGHGEIALGNVIGSNTANIGLILGIAVLVRPARVDGALRRRELPALVASAAVIPPLSRFCFTSASSRWPQPKGEMPSTLAPVHAWAAIH
jgi:cation:H+ antiporter